MHQNLGFLLGRNILYTDFSPNGKEKPDLQKVEIVFSFGTQEFHIIGMISHLVRN
jgi:hypothetical protein